MKFKEITAVSVFMLTLLHPLAAFARQWVVISENPEVAVDVNSIKGTGDTRTFWSRIIYNENSSDSSLLSRISESQYRRLVSLVFVDCEQQKLGFIRTIRYDKNGRVVDDYDISHMLVPPNLQSVVPDSVGETQLLYICSLRTNNKPPIPKTTPTITSSVSSSDVDLPVLRVGMQGPAVIRLQQRLRSLGLFKGDITGFFGPLTEAAVKAAQQRFRLEADGIVGFATWEAILR